MSRLLEPIATAWPDGGMRRVMRPINKQIATRRRQHKPVAHLIAARKSLLQFGLRGAK